MLVSDLQDGRGWGRFCIVVGGGLLPMADLNGHESCKLSKLKVGHKTKCFLYHYEW